LNQNGEGKFSNRMGEFDFELETTSNTDFNAIALPLVLPGITNAQELMETIPGCNSVARWNPEHQSYEQYIPGLPFTNFPVYMGHPYYVNSTVDTIFTLLGHIESPTFDLVATSGPDFNEIMLPLDKSTIVTASDLMADIPNCNSVARWNTAIQGYEQFVPGLVSTDFEVTNGYPYYVNVAANVIWPSTGTAKEISVTSEKKIDENGYGSPHIVCGTLMREQENFLEKDLNFSAYIKSRPEEKLTAESAGCKFKDGLWIVQCGNFPSKWKRDEILCVEFRALDGNVIGKAETSLTYKPVDVVGEVDCEALFHIPERYWFSQNYPNPFNPETCIDFQLPEDGKVIIGIYNTAGQEVRRLMDMEKKAGVYTVQWKGMDDFGDRVSSGVYFIQMRSREFH